MSKSRKKRNKQYPRFLCFIVNKRGNLYFRITGICLQDGNFDTYSPADASPLTQKGVEKLRLTYPESEIIVQEYIGKLKPTDPEKKFLCYTRDKGDGSGNLLYFYSSLCGIGFVLLTPTGSTPLSPEEVNQVKKEYPSLKIFTQEYQPQRRLLDYSN